MSPSIRSDRASVLEEIAAIARPKDPAPDPAPATAALLDLTLHPRDLDGHLLAGAIGPFDIRLARGDQIVAPTEYTTSVGGYPPFPTAQLDPVATIFGAGATILWLRLGRYRADALRAGRALADLLGRPCSLEACITPPNRSVPRVHDRPDDALVVQLFGAQPWTLWPTTSARGTGFRFYDSTNTPPALESTLSVGECLYVPANTPYQIAKTDQVSAHITFRFRALTGATSEPTATADTYEVESSATAQQSLGAIAASFGLDAGRSVEVGGAVRLASAESGVKAAVGQKIFTIPEPIGTQLYALGERGGRSTIAELEEQTKVGTYIYRKLVSAGVLTVGT